MAIQNIKASDRIILTNYAIKLYMGLKTWKTAPESKITKSDVVKTYESDFDREIQKAFESFKKITKKRIIN